ncbi:MAG: response regulator transcription factor [Oscillospiraceae bacterium]|nr:response regulator transcription factor [Oscillospiraceae bacterium]
MLANILLVEDDRTLAENLVKYLRTEDFSVVHAFGQTDGLKAFEDGEFDCVLLDISLGDGNGFSICSEIKKTRDVPVIFLTASADEGCTVAGFEVGADDYIGKPFRPRELVARIKNAMRKRGASPAQPLQCKNVCVDPVKGIVTKNGEEISMSALEYRLLLLFFTNKGILLSRDRIADELWTISGEFVEDNTLNVYIKRIRDKIEDDPQKPQILKTVRGLGYKAVDE